MMKKNRLIFYTVFGVLHLFIFLFSLYMDANSNDFGLLISLQGKIWLLKYCSFILLVLMGVNVVLHYRDNRRNDREKSALLHEMNTLKAKVYDYQEAEKKAKQNAAS